MSMMGDRPLSQMGIDTAYIVIPMLEEDLPACRLERDTQWAGVFMGCLGCAGFFTGPRDKYRTYVNWLICPYLSNSALKACANSATPYGVSAPYLRSHPRIASINCEAATMPFAAATENKYSAQPGMRILEIVPSAYFQASDDI